MATLSTRSGEKKHRVVSEKEWLTARKALLREEKKLTRSLDRLRKQRRDLPWVKVGKDYVFDGPRGPERLADLFGNNRQLIVYHFMFGPKDTAGCPHCSFWADHFDGAGLHLGQRDTAFAVISRAPMKKLTAFKKRMGWRFKWVSSAHNDFNYDLYASFRPADTRRGEVFYNYATGPMPMADREGVSTFYRDDDGGIYHTYSAYARGIDMLNTTYHFLDLTAKGRDEDPEWPQDWVRHHDKYPRSR
jgi:predicted dithiol-disulfide oxidoreductase (DUF899 family)